MEREGADETREEPFGLRLSRMTLVKDDVDSVKEQSEGVRIGLEDDISRRSCGIPVSFCFIL
jgi:hypothetical protein